MDTKRRRHRARPPQAAAIAASAALALTAAACGGSSSSSATGTASAAGGGNPAQSQTSARLEQFALCMRSHGEPSFPDPNAQGKFVLPAALATGSRQFRAADQACRSLAPAGALSGQAPTSQQLSQALKFVHCMRANGISLPDPTPQGSFANKLAASGVDPSTPQFKSALASCRSLLPAGNGFGTGG